MYAFDSYAVTIPSSTKKMLKTLKVFPYIFLTICFDQEHLEVSIYRDKSLTAASLNIFRFRQNSSGPRALVKRFNDKKTIFLLQIN